MYSLDPHRRPLELPYHYALRRAQALGLWSRLLNRPLLHPTFGFLQQLVSSLLPLGALPLQPKWDRDAQAATTKCGFLHNHIGWLDELLSPAADPIKLFDVQSDFCSEKGFGYDPVRLGMNWR
jgi:hypothetical protein